MIFSEMGSGNSMLYFFTVGLETLLVHEEPQSILTVENQLRFDIRNDAIFGGKESISISHLWKKNVISYLQYLQV